MTQQLTAQRVEEILDKAFEAVTPSWWGDQVISVTTEPGSIEEAIVNKLRIGWTIHETALGVGLKDHQVIEKLNKLGIKSGYLVK